MPKVVVPASLKNEAMKIAMGVAGAAGFAVAGSKVADHHHKKIKEKLKEAGHSHKELEHHEATPEGHVVLHTA